MIGNNLYWIDVLYLTIFSIVFIVVGYSIGSLLFNVKAKSESRATFYNSVLGTLLIICIYSTLLTGGKTVNICSLMILIYLAAKNRNHIKIENIKLRYLSPFLFIFPTVFFFYGLYSLSENIRIDIRYYAKIAYHFRIGGNENIYHFYNEDAKLEGMVPYHYLEMWFASFFANLTHSLSIYSLKNFAYPFLISLLAFGILPLGSNPVRTFLIFLLISLIPIGSLLEFFDVGWALYTDFWNRPNLITYYLLLILLLNAVLDSNIYLFNIFIGIGITFSIIIAPVIIGATIITSLLSVFLYRKETLKEAIKAHIIPVSSLLLLFTIYKFWGSSINSSTTLNLKSELQYGLSIWKAILGTFTLLFVELILIPTICVLLNKYVLKLKELNYILIFIIASIVSGLVLFQALTQVDNSYQFSYFGYASVGFLAIVFGIVLLERLKNKAYYFVTTALIAVLVFYFDRNYFDFRFLNSSVKEVSLKQEGVSEKWCESFLSFKRNLPEAEGGFVYSKNDLLDFRPILRHSLTRQMGSFICYLTDDCNLHCLTCSDLLLFDYKEKYKANKVGFEKALKWISTFPYFKADCQVENYLDSGKFDYLICSTEISLSPDKYIEIVDPARKVKLVYRK